MKIRTRRCINHDWHIELWNAITYTPGEDILGFHWGRTTNKGFLWSQKVKHRLAIEQHHWGRRWHSCINPILRKLPVNCIWDMYSSVRTMHQSTGLSASRLSTSEVSDATDKKSIDHSCRLGYAINLFSSIFHRSKPMIFSQKTCKLIYTGNWNSHTPVQSCGWQTTRMAMAWRLMRTSAGPDPWQSPPHWVELLFLAVRLWTFHRPSSQPPAPRQISLTAGCYKGYLMSHLQQNVPSRLSITSEQVTQVMAQHPPQSGISH